MHTQNHMSLERLIQRSVLLTQDRRAALLQAVPRLNEEGRQALFQLLQRDEGSVERIGARIASGAASRGDAFVLEHEEAAVESAVRDLRAGEERAEADDPDIFFGSQP